MSSEPTGPKGRGALSNPPNRFEKLHLEPDPDAEVDPSESPAPRTQFFIDRSCSILTRNDSPDVGFDISINPYRGCEHGCIYCYARPTHEYLGFSAGLDFETKIFVKQNAPELLREELSSKRWQPRVVSMSGVTDCYQPVERKLELTRRCLEVFAEFRNPVAIVTKNFLVTRDIDVLQELARHRAVAVFVSLTSLDSELAREMEPRTSMPSQRIAAIEKLAGAGIPAGVLMAPVIPGLNDHEMVSILQLAADAGAGSAGYVMVRLPYALKELFTRWLETHYPLKREKVLGRIRAVRQGELNSSDFGSRMRGEGIFAEQIAQMFAVARRKAGIARGGPELSTTAFRRAGGVQMEMF